MYTVCVDAAAVVHTGQSLLQTEWNYSQSNSSPILQYLVCTNRWQEFLIVIHRMIVAAFYRRRHIKDVCWCCSQFTAVVISCSVRLLWSFSNASQRPLVKDIGIVRIGIGYRKQSVWLVCCCLICREVSVMTCLEHCLPMLFSATHLLPLCPASLLRKQSICLALCKYHMTDISMPGFVSH